MKERLIQSLVYPRYFVQNHMEIHDCVHSGLYAPNDLRCRECDQREECKWIFSNEEFAAFQEKPIEALLAALEFALDFVDAHIEGPGHKGQRCHCTTCSWLRDAQQLLNEAHSA